MRISTNQIFMRGLNGVLAQQAETLRLQQQMSSQKKIQSPSDDPISAAKIDLMKRRISDGQQLQKNRDASLGALSLEEGTLGNIVSVTQRIREIQVQGGNSALSEADRKALKEETVSLLGQLQGLANSRDSNGSYLFSGTKASTQPITRDVNGQFVYNGDETQRFQSISSGLDVAVSDNASDLFMRLRNGNGYFTVQQTATPNVGSAAINSGSVTDVSSYVSDDYTLQFALNSSNQIVVMVAGVGSGSVVPPSGNVDDAPVYQNGATVTFNGMQVTITGNPVVGDSFYIRPSTNESLFSTVDRMVANFSRSYLTTSDKAAVETENNQLLEQLDTGLNNILAFQAQVGSRLNQLDVAEQVNDDVLQTSQDTLSTLEDVNLAEVAVKLELQRVYLQAAQQTFARIQGLSVFNYI